MSYDPPGDFLKHPLYVCGVIAHHHTSDCGAALVIIHLDFRHGYVKFLVQTGKQWFERPPLVL